MADAKIDPLETTTGNVLEDLGVKPCVIGDMISFRDNAGIKWTGPIVDIRRCGVWSGGGCDGLLVQEDAWTNPRPNVLTPNHGLWSEAPSPWAFVAIIAQTSTVAVRLKDCGPVERGWWRRTTAKRKRSAHV